MIILLKVILLVVVLSGASKLKSIFICSILEYFTSYFMEKIFKTRWWDYSYSKYNINGRICLDTMLPFGILGCVVIYILHPIIINLVNILSNQTIIISSILLFILYIVDNILSFNVMNKIKKEIEKHSGDSTEIIKKKIVEWLSKNSILYRHIHSAYPRFKIREKIISKIREKIN